jgi:histidinol-phosphate aminotransferase
MPFVDGTFDAIVATFPAEYVTSPEYPDSLSYLKEYPNMVVLRTFSKAYGLAGIRVGYGICSRDLAKYFNAVIGPFDVNGIAQAAAAAAINDMEFVTRSYEMNQQGKAFLYSTFEYMDLQYIKTESNFIMVNIRSDDKAVFEELLKRGVIVKPGSSLGMPGFLRVSIGSMEQNVKFIGALKSVLGR